MHTEWCYRRLYVFDRRRRRRCGAAQQQRPLTREPHVDCRAAHSECDAVVANLLKDAEICSASEELELNGVNRN